MSLPGLGFEPCRRGPLAAAALSALCALALAGLLGSLVFRLFGAAAADCWLAIWQGAVGGGYGFAEILVKTAPLTLTGLAVALACRLRLWNVGAEGQFVLGAVASGFVALFLGPGWSAWALLPACLAAGALGGALWALGPAWLKARLGVSEVLATLLLNYVAALYMEHLYYGPWRDPAGMGFPGTPELPEAAWLPTLLGTRAHWGLVLALVSCAFLFLLLSRTRWGFRARVLGESPRAAAYAGFNAARITLTTLCLSGALAGLAGAGELLGVQHRMQDGLASGLGFDGIIVAFLARLSPLFVPLAAAFLGALQVGADQLQAELRLPGAVTLALEAALLFGALLGDFLSRHRLRLRLPAPKTKEDGHA